MKKSRFTECADLLYSKSSRPAASLRRCLVRHGVPRICPSFHVDAPPTDREYN